MFKIGKLFHLTHVVDDIDAVDRWYDEVFSVNCFYHGYEDLAGRTASLIALSDVVMEPMTPSREQNLRNPSVQKFHQRFGQHFHSIAWYVDDVQSISERLDQNGYRLYNIVGKQVKPPHKATAIWTHPRETPGQLEFALPGDFTPDPRLKPDWSSAFWRDAHPLGIERLSHMTVIVGDLAKAKKLYCEVLDSKLIHEHETSGRKKSAYVVVSEDSILELAQPLSPSTPEGRDLEKNGEGVFAMTFQTRDLGRAEEFLKSKRLSPEALDAHTIALGTNQAFGMTVGFTDQLTPGDPRSTRSGQN
jgi:catechol 2,3-dioxygenase-like lactoylglutathione lyase family enzyme